MKYILLTILPILISSCSEKSGKPISTASNKNSFPIIHNVELSEEFEQVNVSLKGHDNLSIRVFERDGKLIACVLDDRQGESTLNINAQRWELAAKSNREVSILTRKDPFVLGEKIGKHDGTITYYDSDGNGLPDYKTTPEGSFKFVRVSYSKYKETGMGHLVSKWDPVKVEEVQDSQ